MTCRRALAITVAILSTACSHSSDDKSGGASLHYGAAKVDTMPLRDGDVRIVATKGGVDLALIGDTISSGLSQDALAKAKAETDTSQVKGSGFGAMIERTVKSSVQGALGTRLAFGIAEIKGARYENGRIDFDWNGKRRDVFSHTTIDKRPLLESFTPGDAQRFVDAINARKHTIAR